MKQASFATGLSAALPGTLLALPGTAAAQPATACTEANYGETADVPEFYGHSVWMCAPGGWQRIARCYDDRPFCLYE